ncbi:unnamed protein product [Symbiodinium sp. KB8]|nr:unnamed protein product [Symbiodinium sp. KB8]
MTKGAILALNSDTLKMERQKLLRAQENERAWLKSALQCELNQLKQLEHANLVLQGEANDKEEKMREQSRKLKELNDKRAAEEERKQMEMEARQKLEKQLAKEEFHKQQLQIQNKAKLDAQKSKEAYERQVRDAERKREIEREKAAKREQEYRDLQARKDEMRAQDQRRTDLMAQKQAAFQEFLRERKDARDMRIYNSIQANQELEQKRRDDFEKKQADDAAREERLMQALAIKQEESAKRSFQTMMKRQVIKEEAMRRAEDRRMAILDQQEECASRHFAVCLSALAVFASRDCRSSSIALSSFKCLVLGGTGLGKTFLNLLYNIAEVGKLSKEAELTVEMIRHCHREAKTNKKDAKKGDSKTKRLALDAVRHFEIKKKETRIVYKGAPGEHHLTMKSRIASASERQMLLNNLEEATFNAQDPETGNSKELYSSKNISLNGVGVRGDLQTTRMSKRATFGTHAQHDHGMSLENVTAKEITSSYGDGEEEYTATKIDEHKRAQFEQLASDEEKQQMALKETEKNLQRFEKLSADKRYPMILKEQRGHVKVLKKNAAGNEETEYRLMEHEAKKERYLDFKRELDGLRAKNKEINVERQRRREDFERESVADAVRKKDDKIDQLNAERQRMWELRRAAQAEAYKAREQVKNEILKQRIQSKFDSKSLEDKLGSLMRNDLFSAKVLQSSHSLPSLRSTGPVQEG